MTNFMTLTEAAIKATNILLNDNPDYRGLQLRIYLAGKGCDGFEYGVTFDAKEASDLVIPVGGSVELICDERTMEFVQGSVIDWVDDERGRGYLVTNPNHKKFRGKFYKRESWKQRFNSAAESQNS